MAQKVSGSKVGGRLVQISGDPRSDQEVDSTEVAQDVVQEQGTVSKEQNKVKVEGIGEATGGRAVLVLGAVAIVASVLYYLAAR